MSQGDGEADGEGRGVLALGPVGVADGEHDQHQDEAEQELDAEALRRRDPLGGELGVAEDLGEGLGGDSLDESCAYDGAHALGDDVQDPPDDGSLARGQHPHGHGRVHVGPGHVSENLNDGKDDEPKRERNLDEVVLEGAGLDAGDDAEEVEQQRAQALGR